MSQDPPKTIVVGHGRILSQLIAETNKAHKTPTPHHLIVGTDVRLFLDRVTGGKGSFNGVRYVEDRHAGKMHFALQEKRL